MLKILPAIVLLLLLPVVSAQAQLPDLDSLSSLTKTIDNVFLLLLIVYTSIGVYKIIRVYRKEGHLPFANFIKTRKGLAVVLLSLVGLAVFIIGMFQPWYTIKADVDSDVFKTGGLKNIIAFDGVKGATVDKQLLGGQELPAQSGLNMVLFSIALSTIFGLLGAKSLRSFGKSNIKSGIFGLLPVILIIVFAMLLPSIVSAVTANIPEVKNNFVLDAFISDFTKSVAEQPVSGEYSKNLTAPVKLGLRIQWGLELGMHLFLLSGIIKIIAGVLGIGFSGKVDKKKKE